MAVMQDIRALIEDSAEQIEAIGEMYEKTLAAKEAPPKLQARIKSILENQRSPLDYLAHAIVERDGTAGAKTYFPLANLSAEFPSLFERNMPGVAAARPDIRDAVEDRQPYQPGHEWLNHLSRLTNENKHRRLSPQTRTESKRVRVDMPGVGAVEWTPRSRGGGVTFGPGVSIGGVPIDPSTQMPVPSATQTITTIIYVDWLFADPPASALGTLQRIQAELPKLIEAIAKVAGLR